MILEWSAGALTDLDRFAEFLRENHPQIAGVVADAIIAEAQILSDHPRLGRPIGGREEFRQVVLQVLNAAYIFQYRYDGKRLVMLRVFHGREGRN
jgi:plasmid stabilization system protein ParE